MKALTISTVLLLISAVSAVAQYAPQAGLAGSTAVSASDAGIVGWGTGCSLQRGYRDIANKSLGNTSLGDEPQALGPADCDIISLGDSGVATLTFAHPIYNGPGADFAVFENGFINPSDPAMAFLELAFVEVSSDGDHFYRFQASSHTPVNTQVPVAGVYMDASLVNNLAGKYICNYGTPFDLQELAGQPGLDVNNITHVRVVDVVGAISGYSTYDTAGNAINDPYPTNVPSGGFDLDAVAAIHMLQVGVEEANQLHRVHVYPNPATDALWFQVSDPASLPLTINVCGITGTTLYSAQVSQTNAQLPIASLPAGIYYLHFGDANGNKWVEKVIKR